MIFSIQVQKPRATIHEWGGGFTFAKTNDKLTIGKTSGNKRGEVAIRRNKANNINVFGVKDIHYINHERYVCCIFAFC